MSEKKKVKVTLDLDGDVLDSLMSLSKMFMVSRDDIINLILRLEIKKKENKS